jgi:hypothetical protein
MTGLRVIRYENRFPGEASRYSCTVNVHTAPKPRRSKSPECA